MLTSTRSRKDADAFRDFDDFDIDEELRRLRSALRAKEFKVVAELVANLDEYLSRGGSLPVAWLGPTCMQDEDDHRARHEDTVERANAMSPQERQTAADYVSLGFMP
jgi:hypothetical protein